MAIYFNSIQEEIKLVKNNILQEFSIFSILVSFYLVGLLNIFKIPANFIMISENYICNYFTYISIFIYIDNRKLTISFYSLDTNNFMFVKTY